MPTELPVLWLPVLRHTPETERQVRRALERILPDDIRPTPFCLSEIPRGSGSVWGFYSREIVVAFFDPEDGNTT
jgi:hypothetical protein